MVNNDFLTEVKGFVHEHPVLCIGTLGIAVAIYSVGNLLGRLVTWIKTLSEATQKVDRKAREVLEEQKDSNQPVGSGSPKTTSPAPVSPAIPELVKFGKFREGSGKPGVPQSPLEGDGWLNEWPNTIAFCGFQPVEQDRAAIFAACFHTNATTNEIYQFLESLANEIFPPCPLFLQSDQPTKRHFVEQMTTLYNNLVELHNALPGKNSEKEAKIYWTDEIETILLPYLFKNPEAKIDDLVFAVVPGEEKEAPLHAETMNYQEQLQFIALDKQAVFAGLGIKRDASGKNSLMDDARKYTAHVTQGS